MRAWVRFGALVGLLAVGVGAAGCGFDDISSCLAAGTWVRTPAGPRLIETLAVGELVTSVDPRSGRESASPLLAVRRAERACVRVRTAGGREVVATADHPFHAAVSGGYVPLGELAAAPGAHLTAVEGGPCADPVVSLERLVGRRAVYDLTVASPLHNFVAGGLLVHNKSEAAPDPEPLDPPGAIQDSLALEDVAAARSAVVGVPPAPEASALGPALTVLSDPVALGPGLVRVLSPVGLEVLYVQALDVHGQWLEGFLELALPAAPVQLDVRATLIGGRHTHLRLRFLGRAGGVVGPAAEVWVGGSS